MTRDMLIKGLINIERKLPAATTTERMHDFEVLQTAISLIVLFDDRLRADKTILLEKLRAKFEEHCDHENHADDYADGYNDGVKDMLQIVQEEFDKLKGDA